MRRAGLIRRIRYALAHETGHSGEYASAHHHTDDSTQSAGKPVVQSRAPSWDPDLTHLETAGQKHESRNDIARACPVECQPGDKCRKRIGQHMFGISRRAGVWSLIAGEKGQHGEEKPSANSSCPEGKLQSLKRRETLHQDLQDVVHTE
jgi:hypothetical protein